MTTTEQTQTQASESTTELGYRAGADRLAAMALVRCWTRERGVQWPVAADGDESADADVGPGSLPLKITPVNPHARVVDLDELVGPTAATGAAEDLS